LNRATLRLLQLTWQVRLRDAQALRVSPEPLAWLNSRLRKPNWLKLSARQEALLLSCFA
jgi:hypothetical protein